MRRLLRNVCCSAVLVFAPAVPAWCADADDLFQVAIPVVSQASAERAQAASLGLRKVLIRMSGSPAVVDTDVAHQAYSQAQNYIEQFHYEPFVPTEATRAEDRDATELLVMTFSQVVIERLLREAGMSYWPPNRPDVLVWLVKDSASGKVLVNDREAPVLGGLLAGAQDRGLNIRLPLLDLEDRLALPARQLWELDENAVLAASERYDADTILVGRFSRTSRGEWLSTWQFFHRGDNRGYDLESDRGVELGIEAMNPLADYLASLYAISPREHGTPDLVMQLSGIENFGDYRQALDYLRGLALVSDLKLRAVRGQTLLLHVQMDGGLTMLRNALALDRNLVPAPEVATAPGVESPPWLHQVEGTPENPVSYIWQGL